MAYKDFNMDSHWLPFTPNRAFRKDPRVFVAADGMQFTTHDGKEVWKADLPTSARATPMLFTTSSGKQMIVIAAGGHDTPFSRIDTKLVAFALK